MSRYESEKCVLMKFKLRQLEVRGLRTGWRFLGLVRKVSWNLIRVYGCLHVVPL